MDFIGTKREGKIVHPPAIAEQKRRHWESIKEGTMVKSSLTVMRKEKTQSQLGAIWGLMMAQAVIKFDDMALDTSYIYHLKNPTGNQVTKDILCKYLYEVCPIYNEDGKKITLSGSNTTQASKFFEDSRNQLASEYGIVISDPNPNWQKEKKEQENGQRTKSKGPIRT